MECLITCFSIFIINGRRLVTPFILPSLSFLLFLLLYLFLPSLFFLALSFSSFLIPSSSLYLYLSFFSHFFPSFFLYCSIFLFSLPPSLLRENSGKQFPFKDLLFANLTVNRFKVLNIWSIGH